MGLQNDGVITYYNWSQFPLKVVDQRSFRQFDLDQPLPQAQLPDEGASGGQELLEALRAHRLRQE